MKLLVDVPDDKYREFMEENAYEVIYDGYWVARVIAKGVPIKDEEFFSMLMKSVMTKEQFDEILQEVAKRPQGEWNYIQAGMCVCPFCGAMPHKKYKNFCAKCGAYMRKGSKNETDN